MKTQYYTAASLDGFIATPDDSLEWLFPLGDIAQTSYPAFIQDIGALAMGSATYEWMLRHVVGPEAARPQPWPYTQPAWVFSSRKLPGVPGADIRFVRGDVRPVHAEMVAAARGKNVWVVGGGDLAGQFHDHGLLDELFVQVGSVTLGAGKPLLPRAIVQPPLRLVSVRAVGTGFAELHYEVPRPAGRGHHPTDPETDDGR
ncbi:MAG TPA: dihydrofolate reductase family protein [Gemmatimonadales bacterium]|nr:dihydrofolate reductase family protein [Gemmatimonadales bacterium]